MPRILLIEDNQPLRRALRISLENAGHSVVEAGDGIEGLAAANAHPVDLVITDMLMPEMDGVVTIRTLRKSKPSLPIIAISGGGRAKSENYLTFAKTFGASLVFEKPLEPAGLCAAVASLLNTGGASPSAPAPP